MPMTDARGFQRQAPASERDTLVMWLEQTIPRPWATARLAETTFSLSPSLFIPAPPLPPSQACPSKKHLHQNACLRPRVQRTSLTWAMRAVCCQEETQLMESSRRFNQLTAILPPGRPQGHPGCGI